MSEFIENARDQSGYLHAMQSMSRLEIGDDGEPTASFNLGKKFAAETVDEIRSGAPNYLLTVVVISIAGMKNDALLHGLCLGLQELLK